jgi:hypothetical protein
MSQPARAKPTRSQIVGSTLMGVMIASKMRGGAVTVERERAYPRAYRRAA